MVVDSIQADITAVVFTVAASTEAAFTEVASVAALAEVSAADITETATMVADIMTVPKKAWEKPTSQSRRCCSLLLSVLLSQLKSA